MIEEHVVKLAELQAELDNELINADFASANTDDRMTCLKEKLSILEKERDINRRPYIEAAEELKTTIGDLYAQIIDEWSGEKKTMVFDSGTLKFRTTQSLKILDETLVLTGLLDHTSVCDVATNYVNGFNKTAVKKYMGVLELPMGAAKIEYKTTVKLEQKSG